MEEVQVDGGGGQEEFEIDFMTKGREGIIKQDPQSVEPPLSSHDHQEDTKDASKSVSSSLHIACKQGHIEEVRHILSEKQSSLEDLDQDGNTSLHIACQHGNFELIKTFLDQFDSTCVNKAGYSLIHIATAASQLDIIKLLFEKSFDPNHYTTQNDRLNCLHLASKSGNMDIVRYFLEDSPKMDPKSITKPSENKPGGQQPIHLAALHGHLDILIYLIDEHGCDPHVEDNSGKTPTLLAGECRNIKVMEFLVKTKGCDPSHSAKGVGKVAAGRQAIHGACFVGHLQMVQYLVEECDIDPHVKDNSGVTPLACASQEGKEDVVDYLCHFKADFNPNIQDSTGRTPLHYACLKGRQRVVELLCASEKIDVDLLDNSAETCTIVACKNSHKDVVSYLVMTKKCRIESSLCSGRRIIDYSSAKNWLEIVMHLVTEIHINPEDFNEAGLSPLHYAAEGNALSVLKYFLEERKCDPNLMSNEGDTGTTPLLRACMFGSLEVVQYLIKDRHCSVSISSRNKLMSPLHLACSGGHMEVVEFLIECGHSLEALNSQNAIPLHMAILNKHLVITRYLIEEHHSDPLRTTKGGATGFHAAGQGGSLNILIYLLEHPRFQEYKDQLYYAPGSSPLDQAAEQGHLEIVRHLVLNSICNPQKRGDNGFTCLHWSASKGRTSVVKFLTEETSCDVLAVNFNGQIPLHLAVSRIDRDHLDTIKCLLTQDKRQLSCKDGNNMTPLQLVKSAKVYSNDGRELKKESAEGRELMTKLFTSFVMGGANPDQLIEVEPTTCNFMKSCIPLYSYTKVFLLGNSKRIVGEMEALEKDLKTVEELKEALSPSCVVPVRVTYRDYRIIGEVMVYEVSSTVTSFDGVLLDAIKCCEAAVFVICVDLNCESENDAGTQLNHWLQFTKSLLARSSVKPVRTLLVSALNVDQSTDINIMDQVSTHCLSLSLPEDHAKLIGSDPHVIYCDEKFFRLGAAKLLFIISKLYNSLQSSQPMNLFPTAVRSLVLDMFQKNSLLSTNLTDLSCHIIANDIPLPSELTQLAESLTELSQSGHLIFMRNEAEIGSSIIMTDPKLILLKLFEAVTVITSPDSPVLTSEDTIKATCHDCALNENDFLKLLDYMKICINVKDHLVIPSLLPSTPKNDLIIYTDHRRQSCLGWLLECDPPHIFTSPLCNQLPFIAASLLPSLPTNGSCNIWSGGAQLSHETMQITLTHLQGEAILLVMKDIRKSLLQMAKKRFSIIQQILNLKQLYSPDVSTQTYLLHPSCLTTMTFNTPSDPSLAAISVQDIFETLGQTRQAFNCSCEDLAGFEPLFILGQRFRYKFFNAENSRGIISPEDSQHIVSSFTPFCEELAIMLQEELSPIFESDFQRTRCVLNEWMRKGNRSLRTYYELWECLKPYSIFSNLSPPPT